MGWLRDWWRGWSNDDLGNVLVKISAAGPGQAVPVTMHEQRAYLAWTRGRA